MISKPVVGYHTTVIVGSTAQKGGSVSQGSDAGGSNLVTSCFPSSGTSLPSTMASYTWRLV
jgi:hypothetical protein